MACDWWSVMTLSKLLKFLGQNCNRKPAQRYNNAMYSKIQGALLTDHLVTWWLCSWVLSWLAHETWWYPATLIITYVITYLLSFAGVHKLFQVHFEMLDRFWWLIDILVSNWLKCDDLFERWLIALFLHTYKLYNCNLSNESS